jgi:RND family efflux transporter MFP subunit
LTKEEKTMILSEKRPIFNNVLRIALLILLATAFLIGCGEEVVKEETVRPVKVFKAGNKISGLTGRSFPGRAEANTEVNLGFEAGGILIERPVDRGDDVKKGQLLARLDPRDFKNELAAAKAERERARAYRDRIAEALKARAVARQDLTDAEARLKEAIAREEIKRKALDDSHIYAPYDGVIAFTYFDEFKRVQAKEKVLRLLDISKIKFTVDLPESLISYVPYVTKAWVAYDAFPGRKIPAKIKEVGTEASDTTRTYPVTLIMDQPKDIKILPGMAGKVSGESPDSPHIAGGKGVEIPGAAVFTPDTEKQDYVWVINESTQTVHRRKVKTGKLTIDGIIIDEGLNLGELVVTAGVHLLKEGQKILIIDEK